jgi:hypothetical protein
LLRTHITVAIELDTWPFPQHRQVFCFGTSS